MNITATQTTITSTLDAIVANSIPEEIKTIGELFTFFAPFGLSKIQVREVVNAIIVLTNDCGENLNSRTKLSSDHDYAHSLWLVEKNLADVYGTPEPNSDLEILSLI